MSAYCITQGGTWHTYLREASVRYFWVKCLPNVDFWVRYLSEMIFLGSGKKYQTTLIFLSNIFRNTDIFGLS